jgi:DNA-binding NarL/FixJ family response regulator
MENNIEIWKDVVGYEEYYQVSNLGRIKRKPRKIINKGSNCVQTLKEREIMPYKWRKGYFVVRLTDENKHVKRYFIHRLVAQAFIPNPENKSQVNHISGNKADNSVHNLEWVTLQENIEHACMNGLRGNVKGENNNYSKLTEKDVLEIVELLSKGCAGKEVAQLYNVSETAISYIKTGKTWSYLTNINKSDEVGTGK